MFAHKCTPERRIQCYERVKLLLSIIAPPALDLHIQIEAGDVEVRQVRLAVQDWEAPGLVLLNQAQRREHVRKPSLVRAAHPRVADEHPLPMRDLERCLS